MTDIPMNLHGDGIEGIHGVREQDEPPWCSCDKGYVGYPHPHEASLSEHEPPPVPNESTPVWDLVIEDMKERDRVGRERYGTPLQAHNGRDPLVDAYQEALDLVVYLRQTIAERER